LHHLRAARLVSRLHRPLAMFKRWWLLSALLLFGCGSGGDEASARVSVELVPASPPAEIDLLFVVDDSSGMSEEQDALARGFPGLVEVLEGLPGGMPSLHVGVVSSDLGLGPYEAVQCVAPGGDGLLQGAPRGSCSGPRDGGRFLRDAPAPSGGARDRNFDGSLAEAFTCIARLGDSGCGFEQHLDAMRRALDGSQPANAGFLRPGAALGVVLLADEDDCSVADPAVMNPDFALDSLGSPLGPFSGFRCLEFGVTCDGKTLPRAAGAYGECAARRDSFLRDVGVHADFLTQLKAPGQLHVTAIVGSPSPFVVEVNNLGRPSGAPSCTGPAGAAMPAVRLRDFLADVPGSSLASICAGDTRPPLVELARRLAGLRHGACLPAGSEPTCDLVELGAGGAAAEVARCAGGTARPCWSLSEDAACAGSPGSLRVTVERDAPAPAGARLRLECDRS
jgi:hypothetical protein